MPHSLALNPVIHMVSIQLTPLHSDINRHLIIFKLKKQNFFKPQNFQINNLPEAKI